MYSFIFIWIFTIFVINSDEPKCVENWGKCGGKNYDGPTNCCLYTRYYCYKTDDYYSECIPRPLKPLPPAPSSDWCGKDGMTLNRAKLSDKNNVNSWEIGQI
eukprot:UN04793